MTSMNSGPLSEPVLRVGPDGPELVTVGDLWREAYQAAESWGAPDPRMCADRYLQGRDLRLRRAADQDGGE